MLLERFLGGDGIEEKLALILLLLRTAAETVRLRHVVAPLVVELRERIELLLEIVLLLGLGDLPFLVRGIGQLLEHRVRFHLLLHEISQLEQRSLKNKKALLELRRQDLLEREILRLKHSRAGHA